MIGKVTFAQDDWADGEHETIPLCTCGHDAVRVGVSGLPRCAKCDKEFLWISLPKGYVNGVIDFTGVDVGYQ